MIPLKSPQNSDSQVAFDMLEKFYFFSDLEKAKEV